MHRSLISGLQKPTGCIYANKIGPNETQAIIISLQKCEISFLGLKPKQLPIGSG